MTLFAPLLSLDRSAQTRLDNVFMWVGLSGVLALYVALALTVNWVSDDAFISYRFARHLAEGHGLVWNSGEIQPVEGYSNFLYVTILGLGYFLGMPMVVGSIWLNLAFSCLTLVLVWRLTLTLAPQARFLSLIPPLLLALNANFRYWAVGGLETHLYALLLVSVAFVLAKGWLRLSPRRLGTVSVLLALTALTRPEGLGIFAGVAAGVSLWLLWTNRHEGLKPLTFSVIVLWGPCLLLLGIHFLWRLSYYHAPLPNTYYAKTGGSWWQWHRGLGYCWHYLLDYDTLLMPMLLAVSVPLWRGRTWVMAGLATLQTAAVVYVGGDGLIHYRFIVPLLPLAYVLLAVSLCDAQVWLRERIRPSGWNRLIRPGVFVLVGLLASLIIRRDIIDHRQRLLELLAWTRHGELAAFGGRDIDPIAAGAQHLSWQLPTGAVVATNLIGRFGFYTDWTILDRLGLCDRHIARVAVPDMGHHMAGHEKRDPAYVFAQRPDVILLGSQMVLDHACPLGSPVSIAADWEAVDLMTGDLELIALPGFWEAYRPEIIPVGDGFFMHLLLRQDVALTATDPVPGS